MSPPEHIVRSLLLGVLFVGLFGTGAELLLLHHTKSLWELIPLVLIGLALIILTWHAVAQHPASVGLVRGVMGLFLLAGLAGIALHFQSSMEFRLETNPSLNGWALFWAAISAKTPPALAPGAMVQLGLLGLVYTYRYPSADAQNRRTIERKMSSMKNSVILSILFAGWVLAALAPLNAQVGRHQGMIEPNVADEKELAKLPHLNRELVKGIVERRPFANMLELHKFLSSSLDSKQLNELYSKMFIQINLNTAPREEIMLIPGMGNRMVREFLEYRPYTAMAQFRKEIGKYVDEKEVARLEQYVFVPINLNTASDETLATIPGATPQVIRVVKDARPYKDMEQFRREIGKSVSAKEAGRLEHYFVIK